FEATSLRGRGAISTGTPSKHWRDFAFGFFRIPAENGEPQALTRKDAKRTASAISPISPSLELAPVTPNTAILNLPPLALPFWETDSPATGRFAPTGMKIAW